MAAVDEIDDPDVSFIGMLTVQPAGVLLQSSLPRHGHREYQSVEWRVIESFSNELASRQQNVRCVGWQGIERRDQRGALRPRHPPVQHK